MAIGYESALINGQLVKVAPAQSFSPVSFGSMYTGPGFWPKGGAYNVPPVLPAPGTWESSTGTMAGGAVSTGFPGPTSGAVSPNGGVNYFHPTRSPLPWALAFLVAGLMMLNYIHYK